MKVKNKKFIKRNEFRKQKAGKGHPVHIYGKTGNDFEFIGLTHSTELHDGTKTIEMDKNPDPTDTATAYFVPIAQSARVNKFNEALKGWELSKTDNEKMKPYRKPH